MTTGERIRKFRKASGFSMEQLATIVKTSKQTIHRYENGTITNIPAEKIEAIAAALGTVPSVLLGWNEDARSEFPVFDTKGLTLSDNMLSLPASDMCVIAPDDSMAGDRILESDILLISKATRVESSDIALVAVGGKSLLRRVFFNGESIVLHASSPKHEPLIYSAKDVEIIGKAVALISKSI